MSSSVANSLVGRGSRQAESNRKGRRLGRSLALPRPGFWGVAHLLLACAFGLVFGAGEPVRAQGVVINEIYYNPPSGDAREQFLELYNPGTSAVSLDGWQLTSGVRYTFPAMSLMPGGLLVVAADPVTFRAAHPEVAPVVGGWVGSLSRRGERLELQDRNGATVDEVAYADEGDWAVRWLTTDWLGIATWEWFAMHDGGGRSLELVDAGRDRNCGQNWGASGTAGGSPGRANSLARTERAPFVTDVLHTPAVPRSTDPVMVSARVRTRDGEAFTATLWHRVDGEAAFTAVGMHDDGQHGDLVAGDGIHVAVLPPRSAGTVVEFYVEAVAAGGATRRWPALPIPAGTPPANLLYQVDDAPSEGPMPFYRLVMTEADRVAYTNRVATQPGMYSNANTSGTFVSWVDGRYEVRYLVDLRNRGQGTRTANFMSFRVDFPSDARWHGVEKLNLNSYVQYAQVLGSAVCQVAGLAMPESRAVQVRLNNGNPATPGWPRFGFYSHNEVLDADFTDRHHLGPANVYRGLRDYSGKEPDFTYRGESPQAYTSDYFKETNQSENDWTDLIGLTRALDPTQTPDDRYVTEVERWVAVTNWVRFFAVSSLLVNRETSLVNGIGDDYGMYRDVAAGQFHLVPWDLDTILNEGDTRGSATTDLFEATKLITLNRFLKHPRMAPLYFGEFLRLCGTVFEPGRFEGLLRQTLGGLVDEPVLARVAQFASARRAYVLSQIPLGLTVEHGLTSEGGYLRSATNVVALQGRAHAVNTRAVQVNGVPAAWSAWEAVWRAPAVPLVPGLNRILVQALDEAGRELERQTLDVWRDAAVRLPVSGTIASDTTWVPVEGVREVSGDLVVGPGATLTVEAGTTVYFGPAARLVVRGGLVVRGVTGGRVRFTRPPGSEGRWGGLVFEGTSADNRLAGLDLEFGDAAGALITVRDARLRIEGTSFALSGGAALVFERASLRLEGCQFTGAGAADVVSGTGILNGGELVLAGNQWTGLDGAGFACRFAEARRPGPIPVLQDNVFAGTRANGLWLAAADARVEGNRVSATGPEEGTGILLTGTVAPSSELRMARNQFSGLRQAVRVEKGATLTLHNNTFAGLAEAAVAFGPQVATSGLASGVDGVNNLFDRVGQALSGTEHLVSPSRLSLRWSLFSDTPAWSGEGNRLGDARLAWVRGALVPQPGSAASGQGWAGWDIGAYVPAGVVVVSDLTSPTPSPRAQFQVWGPGVTGYAARLDGGALGPWQPVEQPFAAQGLAEGDHQLEISASTWDDTSEEPTTFARFVWRVDRAASAVVMNELQARRQNGGPLTGPATDWIELVNRGDAAVALDGMGLSNDKNAPYRYRFAAGQNLAPGAFLVLASDTLGFSLEPRGDTIRLTSRDGVLLDSIEYGPQVDGWSVARDRAGTWQLAWPTPGLSNQPCPTGNPANLRLNEWLAEPGPAWSGPFVELYNRDPLPVGLRGLFLSDYPATAPRRQPLPPLGFVAGHGWLVLQAGDDLERGGLAFNPTADQGVLGLLDSDGAPLDVVWYPPQRTGVSTGRSPDGMDGFRAFEIPRPGAPNVPSGESGANVVPLVAYEAAWKYDERGVGPGPEWAGAAFDDTGWAVGNAPFASEASGLPLPTQTPLRSGPVTHYFRLRFDWPLNQAPDALRLYALADDGMVVHLNGEQVFSLGMPAGASATPTTLAVRTLGKAAIEGPFDLPPERLVAGSNVLAVEVHQAASPGDDVTFALKLETIVSNLPPADVRINEVLTDNRSAFLDNGYAGDWIELRNLSPYPANLEGMTLEDDAAGEHYRFPAGSWMPARSLRLWRCDPDNPASADNTGFGLRRSGDALRLVGAGDVGLLDSLRFGFQAPDVSLARSATNAAIWGAAQPTPGRDNVLYPDPGVAGVRLNEWMARPTSGDDWLELYNSANVPVNVGGCYLSDDPNSPTLHRLEDFSFIGGDWYRYQRLAADENLTAGADHLAFRLSGSGESLALSDPRGGLVDQVRFGNQAEGVSEGRFPDGAPTLQRFPGSASPGAANYLDSDQDGLPDAWELSHGFDPQSPVDPVSDVDHDGVTDLAEYLAGTNPRDPDDAPSIALTVDPEGGRHLRFLARPGRAYVIESSPRLVDPIWLRVMEFKARGREEFVEVVERPPVGEAARFYRLRIP